MNDPSSRWWNFMRFSNFKKCGIVVKRQTIQTKLIVLFCTFRILKRGSFIAKVTRNLVHIAESHRRYFLDIFHPHKTLLRKKLITIRDKADGGENYAADSEAIKCTVELLVEWLKVWLQRKRREGSSAVFDFLGNQGVFPRASLNVLIEFMTFEHVFRSAVHFSSHLILRESNFYAIKCTWMN